MFFFPSFGPSSALESVTSQTSINSGPHIWKQDPLCSQRDESPENQHYFSWLSQLWAGSMQLNEPLLMQSRLLHAPVTNPWRNKPAAGWVHCQQLSLMTLQAEGVSCTPALSNPKGNMEFPTQKASRAWWMTPSAVLARLIPAGVKMLSQGTARASLSPWTPRHITGQWEIALIELTAIRSILKNHQWGFGGRRVLCW